MLEDGDFEAAAQFIQAAVWADPDKIGVFGGSYGGFACLTCMSRLPQYFACGVDLVGPSNLVTLAKSVPPKRAMRMMVAARIMFCRVIVAIWASRDSSGSM